MGESRQTVFPPGRAGGCSGRWLLLKGGGRFVVLDPIIEEAKDAVDAALEAKINQVFRRTHGPEFRFHTASSIQRLLTKAGYRFHVHVKRSA